MSKPNKIIVLVPEADIWKIGQPVHAHVYVGDQLRRAGIPIEGGLEFRSVAHGQLTFKNKYIKGKRVFVYEWLEHSPDEEEI